MLYKLCIHHSFIELTSEGRPLPKNIGSNSYSYLDWPRNQILAVVGKYSRNTEMMDEMLPGASSSRMMDATSLRIPNFHILHSEYYCWPNQIASPTLLQAVGYRSVKVMATPVADRMTYNMEHPRDRLRCGSLPSPTERIPVSLESPCLAANTSACHFQENDNP